jgi:hypothetical protein
VRRVASRKCFFSASGPWRSATKIMSIDVAMQPNVYAISSVCGDASTLDQSVSSGSLSFEYLVKPDRPTIRLPPSSNVTTYHSPPTSATMQSKMETKPSRQRKLIERDLVSDVKPHFMQRPIAVRITMILLLL